MKNQRKTLPSTLWTEYLIMIKYLFTFKYLPESRSTFSSDKSRDVFLRILPLRDFCNGRVFCFSNYLLNNYSNKNKMFHQFVRILETHNLVLVDRIVLQYYTEYLAHGNKNNNFKLCRFKMTLGTKRDHCYV